MKVLHLKSILIQQKERAANRIKFFHHLENGSRIAILSETNQNLLTLLYQVVGSQNDCVSDR